MVQYQWPAHLPRQGHPIRPAAIHRISSRPPLAGAITGTVAAAVNTAADVACATDTACAVVVSFPISMGCGFGLRQSLLFRPITPSEASLKRIKPVPSQILLQGYRASGLSMLGY